MNRKKPFKTVHRGFALVVTLSLMILLTVIAVGLLSLSAISLRTSSGSEALSRAHANARLAVMMALGELQKQAGDDRRVSADASISGTPAQPHAVGIWDGWSPNMAALVTQSAPNYAPVKKAKFRTWLASAPDPEKLKDPTWPDTAPGANGVRLFSVGHDGFDLSAAPVPTRAGAFAWIVSQENTKAKINISGPENDRILANANLHAQSRPSFALSTSLKQPKAEWNLRAGRVLSMSQAKLDPELTPADAAATPPGASFTAYSQGLLTDPVKGGFKIDLSLAFEMSDLDFAKTSWDGTPNPFRSPNSPAGFYAPSLYRNQQPIFRPQSQVENPIISITTDFPPASVANRYFAAGVPTFDHLRSFYRIPHHLYGSAANPVVAERGPDHIAVKLATSPPGGTNFAPGNPPLGKESKLSVRPVLNRMIYLFSYTLGPDDRVRLIITPIISIWNPYNVDLEIDGAVAYPWIDVPFEISFNINGNNKVASMSRLMGKQFASQDHGRSVDPFFFCEITSDGDKDAGNNQPIRFKPGEVRVFVPASPTPMDFVRLASNYGRTVQMRPVDSVGQFNKRGGLSIAMDSNMSATGFNTVVKTREMVSAEVRALNSQYHYFVSLEDSARIKNRSDTTHGETISEIQVLGFVSQVDRVTSAGRSYEELKSTPIPFPFGVLETFHRVAKQGTSGQAVADLIYSTNPRHSEINHQLAYGSFTVAPHFQSTLRSASSFDAAIQTTPDGRDSYWGPSQSSSGKNFLPFFEIPREPMVSLAGFQHADLAASTFSSANQFANSWASPYLARTRAAMLVGKSSSGGSYQLPIYDQPYLANEALWDSYFLSSAAPRLQPAGSGKPSTAWNTPIATEQKSLNSVLTDFIADPGENPLPDSRMRLVRSGSDDKALVQLLESPAGCTRIASHLTVDGAFNVNSTDPEAWAALFAGGRGQSFNVEGSSGGSATTTAFPRFRHPTGQTNDNWNGYRDLNDEQIRKLAENCVQQVKLRGPFLSLAEFVNRRLENSALGAAGAIQAAIDIAKFNDSAKQTPFNTAYYPPEARGNIVNDTGVGIPGYLTQADVLQSLAPILTARSDTFTIRGYGEAKDPAGKVIARACYEAVVQRMPAFVDATDPPETKLAAASVVNKIYGRRFEIVSYRQVPLAELQ